MVEEIKNKEMVAYLNYLNRTYWSLTDMIAAGEPFMLPKTDNHKAIDVRV